MNKYLLIDGNNLAVRAAFANKNLRDQNGVATGLHYGFFKSLVSLKKQFVDYFFVICWDSKSKKRIELSSSFVEKKIIKSAYKANREINKTKPEFIELHEQLPFLKDAVDHFGIPQVRLEGCEADDIIAAYCKKLRIDNEIVVVTTDHDYYQMLHENVSLWDGLHQKTITKKSFEEEYKITPEQWVDVGTLMGDDGDNIFGIPSWGEKTALEEVQKHGSYKKVLEYYQNQHRELDSQFPVVESMLDMESLKLQTTKSGKPKYSDLYYGMPFSGAALAIEQKKIKPIPQKALLLLMYQERLDLAYDLKKSYDEIENLPIHSAGEQSMNVDGLREYFNKYSINLSILEELSNTSDRKEEKVEIMNDVGEKEEEANLFLF